MVQKKEEKRKEEEKKPKSILERYSDIQKNLISSEKLHKTLVEYSQGIKALSDLVETNRIRQSAVALQGILAFQKAIGGVVQQASVVQALQVSSVARAMAQYQRNVQSLVKNYETIGKLVQLSKVDIPLVTARIENIPSQTSNAMRSLLSHIDYLERELAKKETENKELIRIIGELKQKAKKEYIV